MEVREVVSSRAAAEGKTRQGSGSLGMERISKYENKRNHAQFQKLYGVSWRLYKEKKNQQHHGRKGQQGNRATNQP